MSLITDLFDVKGKVVLVTGGGSGIGRMFTEAFVKNGAKVFICSRKLKVCQQLADELNSSSTGECVALCSTDLGQGKKACLQVVEELKKHTDKLDVLINNSGVTWGEMTMDDFDEEKGFDRVMNINVKSLFFMTMACAPLLQAASTPSNPSRVINIGSVLGIMTRAEPTPSYDASKAAVHHLTKKLAAYLAERGVTVNAIAPGLVPSKMGDQAIRLSGGEVEQRNPLGRIGRPDDMGGVAIYLASRAGSWVTGTVIPVDGGELFAKL